MSDYIRLDIKYKGKIAGPYSGDLGNGLNATTILSDIGAKRRKQLNGITDSKTLLLDQQSGGYHLHPNRAITDMEKMFEPAGKVDNDDYFNAMNKAQKSGIKTLSAFKQSHFQKVMLTGDNFKRFKHIKNTLASHGMELIISHPKISKKNILYQNEREILFKKD